MAFYFRTLPPLEGALPGHNHRHTHAGHTLRVTPVLAGTSSTTTSPSPVTRPPVYTLRH